MTKKKVKYTVVIPYIYEPYKIKCLKNCKLSNLLLIDNTENNLGIMRSHNMGIAQMQKDDSNWLIILSCAIRFGEKGGLDFIEHLNPEYKVMEAIGVFGWHFIAFSREVIEKVGKWDENFTPYGYDDLDYSWRIRQVFGYAINWPKIECDVTDAGMAHSIRFGKVKRTLKERKKIRNYWKKKWGADIPKHVFKTPYNLNVTMKYWQDAPNGGKWK